MYKTGAWVSQGCQVLVQMAVVFNILTIVTCVAHNFFKIIHAFATNPDVLLPATDNEEDGEDGSWFSVLANFADLVLRYEVMMSMFDLVVETGRMRSTRAIKELLYQDWMYLTLSLMSLRPPPMLLRRYIPACCNRQIMQLLRIPHFFAVRWIPVSTYSKSLLKALVLQMMIVYAALSVGYIIVAGAPVRGGSIVVLAGWLGMLAKACLNDNEKMIPESGRKMKTFLQHSSLKDACRVMVAANPLFKNVVSQSPAIMDSIIPQLRYEHFVAGSTIVSAGEVGNQMFFLLRGTVVGIDHMGGMFTKSEGESFGELALMRSHKRRSATLKARTACELFLLNQDTFDDLCNEYPLLAKKVRDETGRNLKYESSRYVQACFNEVLWYCAGMVTAGMTTLYLAVSIF